MVLNNYAPIGKSILHRAAGIKENYIMIHSTTPECCKDCPIQSEKQTYEAFPDSIPYKNALDKCKQCPNWNICNVAETNKKLKNELMLNKKYINEKNKYGSEKRLKYTAIMLLILCHLMKPDENGILRDQSVEDMAQQLKCSIKAVKYNLDVLAENGSIFTSPSVLGANYVNICLCDYASYFKPASEGGRGYFVMSKELFNALLSFRSSNLLRIVIKTLLYMDEVKTDYKNGYVESYTDIHSYLPAYCKRNVIKKALDMLSDSIFNIFMNEKYVKFKLNPELDGKTMKKKLKDTNALTLKERIDNINEALKTADERHSVPVFSDNVFNKFKPDDYDYNYKPLKINTDKLASMVNLSVEYSLEHVWTAFCNIYYSYICTDEKIKNFGGLLRSKIRDLIIQTSPATE